MQQLFVQLKNRQVFKVATIYVVAAWPLIQIIDLAIPALGLPDSVMALVFKVVIIGFPVALIFAWLINFTTRGMVLASVDESKPNAPWINFRATLAIAGSLALALGITIVSQLVVEQPAMPLSSVPSAESAAPVVADNRQSIAVLPFVPFSKDPQDEYFVDGMVEELLNLLANIPDLQVAARTSSFAYKGVTDKSIVEIGQELGVDTILEGSLRKNDVENRIRVTAQLIKVSTGEHIWSETYDREYRDIFRIQDDIASAVAEKMKVTLLGENEEQVEFAVGTESVDAMVEYGRGQKELGHRTAGSLELALEYFKRAVAIDENYARAHVGIADATSLLALYGSLPPQTARVEAEAAISKALELNPNLGEAYASRGLLLTDVDHALAEQAFQKAIELSPSYAMAYMWYASLMKDRGNYEKSQELYEHAYKLDPKSPVAAYNLAWGFYNGGSEAKAMEMFTQIIANDPYYPGAYTLVGNILTNRGRLDEAIEMFQRALMVDAENKTAVYGLLMANMDMANAKAVEYWFDYAKERPQVFAAAEIAFMEARHNATLGKFEEAIGFLEQAAENFGDPEVAQFIRGEIAFVNADYEAAVAAYEELWNPEKNAPTFLYHMFDGQAMLHLAYSYQRTGATEKADAVIAKHEEYLKIGLGRKPNDPNYYYNLSLINALRGDTEQAYNYLQGAIDVGWVQSWKIAAEPIFDGFSSEERFQLMLGGVNAKLATMRTRVQQQEQPIAAAGG